MATRPEEKKVLKAMKEAKTAEEMIASWFVQRPGYEGSSAAGFDFFLKRKPEMISTFAHNQLTQLVERGILDPKTRYLCILGCYIMANHWDGLMAQCSNARAAGATDEEIMEVAFIACYAAGKAKNADTSNALGKVLDSPTYKKVRRLTEEK
jgi:alkylhydroperoxidase/carboxymuconolactone decarboxylase family protein YurZ